MRRLWIIIPIMILIFCATGWLVYNLTHRPYMTLVLKFRETPPIVENIIIGKTNAYYRGYKVGKVSKITLSDNQQYILLYLDIFYRGLKLPENTKFMLRTKDIFGDRYVEINYPDNPSNNLLDNGEVVEATSILERLDKYLIEELQKGTLSKLMSNLLYISSELKEVIEANQTGLDDLSKGISGPIQDAGVILNNLRELVENPQTKKDIRQTLKYASSSLENLNEIIQREDIQETIANAPELINETVNSLKSVSKKLPEVNKSILAANESIEEANVYIPGINETLSDTNSLLCNTNYKLTELNDKIPKIPEDLPENANDILKRYDCIGQALSESISKRFLLFRFVFGNPAKPFDKCIRIDGSCFDKFKK